MGNAEQEMEQPAPASRLEGTIRWAGLAAGPLAGLAAYLLLPAVEVDAAGEVVRGLTREGRATAGVGALMAVQYGG